MKTNKLPQGKNEPQDGQLYDNSFGLVLVPEGKDPAGQPRPPLNLILHYLLVQHAGPPGFVPWEPSCYPDQKWLHWAPEYCCLPNRYQLNQLLRYLHDLDVKDFKILAPLVYAADYGAVCNPVRRRIKQRRNELYNGNAVSKFAKEKCVRELIEFVVDTCGYHYRWDPQIVAEEKACKAIEDDCLTVAQWEAQENPKDLTYLVHGRDRQGKKRKAMKKIINCLNAERMPPGFTPNRQFAPPIDLKWWLRWVPEYTLLDCYNLAQLVEWLDNMSLSVEDKMAVIYASDYGYTDSYFYKRTKEAKFASYVTHKRAFLLAGFKRIAREELIACGSQATQSFRTEFYKDREA